VSAAALAIDGGDLPFGGGLLALVRPALLAMTPGGVLALRSTSPGVRQDLPSWCRVERHEYLGCEPDLDGRDRHLIRRGSFGVPQATSDDPKHADPHTGFAPRGALVEPGGPAYPVTLTARDLALPPETRQLYDQAVAAQWDARELAWDRVRPLPPALERALRQVMTFLAENELSALYVPSKFVARLHPAFAETAMFLATQLMDEARHIDVFLRRAGAVRGVSSVTTARSLLALLELEDFSEAAFLLSVLGEGTFLDLLRFVEEHAPDEVTADLARRARADEARHERFGIAHVRHVLSVDPQAAGRLEAAVRRRAAALHGIDGVPAPIQDALTILASGGDEPGLVARGHEAFQQLLADMHEGRLKRLTHAGFTLDQAQALSELHTPNFM
jgi:TusA-related sulfurtransferase